MKVIRVKNDNDIHFKMAGVKILKVINNYGYGIVPNKYDNGEIVFIGTRIECENYIKNLKEIMKITERLLKEKGFKLNTYPKNKFWEWQTEDPKIIKNILQQDYFGDENEVCLQLKEDFTNKKLAANGNVWEIETEEDFLDILKRIPSKD